MPIRGKNGGVGYLYVEPEDGDKAQEVLEKWLEQYKILRRRDKPALADLKLESYSTVCDPPGYTDSAGLREWRFFCLSDDRIHGIGTSGHGKQALLDAGIDYNGYFYDLNNTVTKAEVPQPNAIPGRK